MSTERLGLQTVNCKFKLSALSINLRHFILECGYNWTNHFLPTAQINGGTTKPLWNFDTEVGLKIYRDYFLCVDLVYPAYHHQRYYEGQENPEVGYLSVEIGRLSYDKKVNPVMDIEYNRNTVEWLKEHRVELDTLYDEITRLFRGNFEVVEDLDYEELMDALECGDLDLADQIIGDRDLCEIL